MDVDAWIWCCRGSQYETSFQPVNTFVLQTAPHRSKPLLCGTGEVWWCSRYTVVAASQCLGSVISALEKKLSLAFISNPNPHRGASCPRIERCFVALNVVFYRQILAAGAFTIGSYVQTFFRVSYPSCFLSKSRNKSRSYPWILGI